MCDLLTASIALGGATAAHSVGVQRNAIKTQRKVQENASIQERKRYLNEVSQTRQRQRQEQIAAAMKIREGQVQAMEAKATAFTSAGQSGVSGLSVDAILGDLSRQEGQYNFNIKQQLEFQQAATENILETAGLGFTSNMLRINKPIPKVDYFGAVLEGAQTGMSFYSAGSKAGFGKSSTSSSSTPFELGTSDLYSAPDPTKMNS